MPSGCGSFSHPGARMGAVPNACDASRAASFARHAGRDCGRHRICHRSRNAHVRRRRQRRGCRHRHHVRGGHQPSSRTSAGAARRPSWCAPRPARSTPSPAWAPCPNWAPPISTASHELGADEIVDPPSPHGLKDWVPVAGPLAALVPGMVDAALGDAAGFRNQVLLRSRRTGHRTRRRLPHRRVSRHSRFINSERYLKDWPASAKAFLPGGRMPQAGRHLPPAGPGAHAALHGRGGKESSRRRSQPRKGHRCRARLFLPRRHRPPHRRVLRNQRRPAALRGHGGVPCRAGRGGLHHISRLHRLQAGFLEPGTLHDRGAQHSGRFRPGGP